MTRISIFGKTECAKCKTTKHKLSHLASGSEMANHVQVIFHDLETLDGRAEGAFYDVGAALPLTVAEKDGREVRRWSGEVPDSQEIRSIVGEGANVAAD